MLTVIRLILAGSALAALSSAPPGLRAAEPASPAAYTVAPDLSNVANRDEFIQAYQKFHRWNETFAFTPAQLEKLAANGFMVIPGEAEQFFHIYIPSHYRKDPLVPNFITSDALLHLYHMLYDFTLRSLEVEDLLPALMDLTRGMLEGSLDQYARIEDPDLKAAARLNVCFFAVPGRFLALHPDLPPGCDSLVQAEVDKMEKHLGKQVCGLSGFEHDYSQYIVRGHYSRNEELRRFFLAMMWYGRSPFPFHFQGKRTEQQVRQALLMTDLLYHGRSGDQPLLRLWEQVYNITTLYVGSADDLEARQYHEALAAVYGEHPALDELARPDALDRFYDHSKTLPQPRIAGAGSGEPTGLQFRFMGQRFMPDSYALQKLTAFPLRSFPMGLDVMAVLGSPRAAALLADSSINPHEWPGYLTALEELRAEFAEFTEEDWYRTLFNGWLYALQSLVAPQEANYPDFMANAAWADKQLNGSLASWAQLRHDTILYGKGSGAEGDMMDEFQSRARGYVEPVPEFYARLRRLTGQTRRVLTEFKPLRQGLVNIFEDFDGLLAAFEEIARKELRGDSLSEAEYERIRYFGDELELLTVGIINLAGHAPQYDWTTGRHKKSDDPYAGYVRNFFEVTGPDRDVACIADVHTTGGVCLEEAVGHLGTIFVVVPMGGELHLTRGAVFSYYEFKYDIAHRFTDEAWQERLKRGQAPAPPPWTASFTTP